MSMRLPNVVHLGFAKCGSTFLQAFWRQHSHVHLVFKSNFFGPFDACSYEKGSAHYATFFENAGSNQLRVESDEHLLMAVFHPTLKVRGINLDSVREICHRLSATVPNAKIILVIRNQLDLLISTYSQYLLGGGTLSLEEFAEEMLNCRSGSGGYFSFHYDQIIECLLEHFPDSVKVILNEEMATHTQERIRELCNFMAIPAYEFKPSFKDRRVGLSKLGMSMVRTLNRCVVKRHATRFEPDLWIPNRVYKTLCNTTRVLEHYCLKHFSQVQRVGLATPRILELVQREFAASNSRLATMLDFDLKTWNYPLPEADTPAMVMAERQLTS